MRQAAAALHSPGGVVLVPTETVYGLVARASDKAAQARIFSLKRREKQKSLGWFVADFRKLSDYGIVPGPWAERLAERYFPGPLTLVVRRGEGTVGIRVPDHPFLAALLAKMREPLVQTSANRSGEPNALSLPAALASLNGNVDMAVDGGEIPEGALASTVLDCSGEGLPRLLRQGGLVIEELQKT